MSVSKCLVSLNSFLTTFSSSSLSLALLRNALAFVIWRKPFNSSALPEALYASVNNKLILDSISIIWTIHTHIQLYTRWHMSASHFQRLCKEYRHVLVLWMRWSSVDMTAMVLSTSMAAKPKIRCTHLTTYRTTSHQVSTLYLFIHVSHTKLEYSIFYTDRRAFNQTKKVSANITIQSAINCHVN